MKIVSRHARFIRTHLYAPVIGFLLLSLVFELSHVDITVADIFFRLEGGQWLWRDAWLTKTLIHEGGRQLVLLMVVAVLAMLLVSFVSDKFRRYRKALSYLLTASLCSGLLINVLKELSHIDCPWDLLRYGGSELYIRNFAALPEGKAPGSCFPAGHASAAWAWICLYFLAYHYALRIRLWVLFAVLLCGFIFGFAQQLRGAHFLSHDLWTLFLCWIIAALLYMVFYFPFNSFMYWKRLSASCSGP